jgi:hypothetical protein
MRPVESTPQSGIGDPMKTSPRVFITAFLACALLSGCAASRRAEETTPDGLVRVPSRSSGGVFRERAWPFAQYRRLILEPLTVSFAKDWEKRHPEASEKEHRRIRDEAAKMFREQFELDLIEKAKYAWANEPEPDVLIVSPTITELDIPAPEPDGAALQRTFAPRSVELRITGELRDAASGRLVGRVDMFEGGEEYGMPRMRETNRGTNAHEIRRGIKGWTQLLREALDVAKNEKQESKLE